MKVSTHAERLVRDLVDDYEELSRAVGDDAATERLHELRILGKKLRYTMEIMVDVLPDLKAPLGHLVAMQEVLGRLQDAEVGLASLAGPADAIVWLRARYEEDKTSALADWQARYSSSVRSALVDEIRTAAST